MNRKLSFIACIAFVVGSLVVGCGVPDGAAQEATTVAPQQATQTQAPTASAPASGELSEHEAIERALARGRESAPEQEASRVPPRVVSAKLSTVQQATQALDGPIVGGVDIGSRVWVVELEGEWLVGMDAPGLTPPAERSVLRHMTVVLDARTGEQRWSTIRP